MQQTIGVNGEWGSDKASLMRLVKNRIAAESLFPIVWFNAWRYEREENLALPLLATIHHELQNSGWLTKDDDATNMIKRLSLALVGGLSVRAALFH